MPGWIENLLAHPVQLFDTPANAIGVTQKGLLFPTTDALQGGLTPPLGVGVGQVTGTAVAAYPSGLVPILNAGGVVIGAVFTPRPQWEYVFLDLIAANGSQSGKVATIEIGRLSALNQLAEVLASVALTTSSNNIGPTNLNPLVPSNNTPVFTGNVTSGSALVTGISLVYGTPVVGQAVSGAGVPAGTVIASLDLAHQTATLSAVVTVIGGGNSTVLFTGTLGHATQTWTTFDATTITSLSQQNDVVQASGGTSGNLQSRLRITVHDMRYYYVKLIASLDASFTEILAAITPLSKN